MTRDDFGKLIDGGIGVEVGVSQGFYSTTLLEKTNLKLLFSIDSWSEGNHNLDQYREASRYLEEAGANRSVIVMLPSNEAVKLFADNAFDFIYIDAYAHTGQNNGEISNEWYPKLKKGGLFAGHDYHKDHWPNTVKAVDRFIKENDLELNLTDEENIQVVEPGVGEISNNQLYPSWYIYKPI
mgnify:FL=1